MAIAGTVYGLSEKLNARAMPAITRWNRLEGRPRTHDFEPRAEGRGARRAVDADQAVAARRVPRRRCRVACAGAHLHERHRSSTAFSPGAPRVEPFSLAMPLETTVERRPIRWQSAGSKLSLDLRLVLGRRWRKMLAKAASAATPAAQRLSADYWPGVPAGIPRRAFRTRAQMRTAAICAHADVWQQVSAVAERAMDGYALLEHIDKAAQRPTTSPVPAVDAAKLAALAQRLREWLATLVEQPTDPARDAWQPERLEYRFACAAPEGVAGFHAVADEYYTGHLDWYSLDRDAKRSDNVAPPGPQPALCSSTFIPTSLVFSGMPNTRWWEFEERQTNFGRVTPDTTDLGKLLLLEFGLVYANDWFVFPYTLPLGSIASVKGIALTNVFGERTWIEPVPTQGQADVGSLEHVPAHRTTTNARSCWCPPRRLCSRARRSKRWRWCATRWRTSCSASRRGCRWRPARRSRAAKPAGSCCSALERIHGAPPAPPAPVAPVRFQLMNTVAEHWIPFLPVHVPGSTRETQLQRGAMPRMVGNDPANFKPVEPRTSVLRPGLDQTPKKPYFVHEEEVPRAGVHVTIAYQRTRWLDGRVFVWLGASKTTGRGEASSGLAFDQLVPTDFKPT